MYRAIGSPTGRPNWEAATPAEMRAACDTCLVCALPYLSAWCVATWGKGCAHHHTRFCFSTDPPACPPWAGGSIQPRALLRGQALYWEHAMHHLDALAHAACPYRRLVIQQAPGYVCAQRLRWCEGRTERSIYHVIGSFGLQSQARVLVCLLAGSVLTLVMRVPACGGAQRCCSLLRPVSWGRQV